MKLLFANTSAASTELKKLLGFIDADLKFENIKPDIITATNELIKLIGENMYNSVVGYYESESSTEEQKHHLYLTQYPIAINAYMLYAPNNDISHTSNGRKMRSDNNEKNAFEWMIDRDNEALEKRLYRALDDLLIYMDSSVTGWKNTDAYKKVKRLFVNTAADFDEYFMINSRLTLMKLEPGLRQCEQREILPRVGKVKFEALKAAVYSGTGIPEEDQQLFSLIQEACVYYSLAWAMRRLSVNIFPQGVLQAYTSDRETTQIKRPAEKMEVEAARQAFNEDAKQIFQKIEQQLAPPVTPESEDCPDLKTITGSNFIST